jgi:AraC-like DNA-binding protein
VPAEPIKFDYQVRNPAAPLGRLVESIWYARGTIPYTREKIAPTGSTVAVIIFGDPIIITADDGAGESAESATGVLVGPHDRPVVNEPTGETFALGVVTTHVGCEGVFGLRPTTIRGRAVDLLNAWPAAKALHPAMRAAGSPAAMLDVLEDHLTHNHDLRAQRLERCEQAIIQLTSDPTRPIADIADQLGVSHGHLDREFTRVVGLTPRALARLLRMRKLLAGIDVYGTVAWTNLAHDLGWYDQAHLIRDFKRHTGVTPSQYVAAQRAIYAPQDAAPGFVPEE